MSTLDVVIVSSLMSLFIAGFIAFVVMHFKQEKTTSSTKPTTGGGGGGGHVVSDSDKYHKVEKEFESVTDCIKHVDNKFL